MLWLMTTSPGIGAASDAGRDSAWEGGDCVGKRVRNRRPSILGIWIRFQGPVVKLAFTRGRLVEWNCVALNAIQLPR
jgi:hypothetical protein